MRAPVMLLATNLALGGAEMQVAQLALALRRRAWNVSVASLLEPSAFVEELAACGIPVFSLRMRPGKANPLAAARFFSLLWRSRPAILHAHMFHGNLLARGIRLVCPVPVVISTIHSIAESSRRSAGVRRRDWLYRTTDCFSDATVCVSAAGAKRYAAIRAVSRDTLRVIPNGVDTDRFRPDPSSRVRMRQALGVGDEFTWLAAGRLMWKKDYVTMLEAMARQREGMLLIAGAGPLEEKLRVFAGELGVRVRFLGLREDIADLMNACDGLVLSSVVEGLPMVLIEAAASGLPCVTTDAGGAREAVLDGQTGFVVRIQDPVALAAAMKRLAELAPEARARMAESARTHALAQFDVRTVAAQWEQLYLDRLEAARLSGLEPPADD
jgi:glycosyltransferase involved in cell wall biosynthesis